MGATATEEEKAQSKGEGVNNSPPMMDLRTWNGWSPACAVKRPSSFKKAPEEVDLCKQALKGSRYVVWADPLTTKRTIVGILGP